MFPDEPPLNSSDKIELRLIAEYDYLEWQKKIKKDEAIAVSEQQLVKVKTANLEQRWLPFPPYRSFYFDPTTTWGDAKNQMVEAIEADLVTIGGTGYVDEHGHVQKKESAKPPAPAEAKTPPEPQKPPSPIVKFLRFIWGILTLSFLFKTPERPPLTPKDRFDWLTPNVQYQPDWDKKSLQELGFTSGELVIIERYRPPLGLIGSLHASVTKDRNLYQKDVVNFFDSVIAEGKHTSPKTRWDKDRQSDPSTTLAALILYTEEDAAIAEYVRQNYSSLHIMSGLYLTLYTFEHFPKGQSQQDNARTFWSKRVPANRLNVWSLMGIAKTKPYPNTEIYYIADQLNVPVDRLPCIVLFTNWKDIREKRLLIPIVIPLPTYFRKVSAALKEGIDCARQAAGDDAKFVKSVNIDTLLHHLPSWMTKGGAGLGEAQPRVFISYRRADASTITGRLFDRLSDAFGRENVFKDVMSIPAGADFRAVLRREVESCDVLLAVIGKSWLVNAEGVRRLDDPKDFVRAEIEMGLGNDAVRVIPVLVDGASLPAMSELPLAISQLVFRNAVKVREDPDFDRDIEGLIGAIRETQTALLN